jgi:hypothetical protein
MSTTTRLLGGAALAAGVSACSPVLDWREARSGGDTLTALLPCKPERRERSVPLAGAPVMLEQLSCHAGGTTWAVTTADVGAAARVGPALEAQRAARAVNLQGRETAASPARVAGMTPQALALRYSVDGRRPDGSALREESLQFARGTRVFHAAALGGAPPADALETFFDSLKLRP